MKIKILSLIAVLLFLTACKETESKTFEEKIIDRQVDIVYSNCAEGMAVAYLLKNILEENLNYAVNLHLAELDEGYEKLALGEHDLLLNAWLPETHQEFFKENEQNLSLAGTVYEDVQMGFFVPEEAEIKKIDEINEFSDTIFGITSSERVQETTKLAIEEYELEVIFIEEDEEKLLETLKEKTEQEKPFVVAGWKPHPIFSSYSLKLLKDPKNIFPQSDRIYTVVNNDFSARDKLLMEFISRFSLSQEQILNLVKAMESSGEEAGAKEWMNNHRPLILQWMENLEKFEEKDPGKKVVLK